MKRMDKRLNKELAEKCFLKWILSNIVHFSTSLVHTSVTTMFMKMPKHEQILQIVSKTKKNVKVTNN